MMNKDAETREMIDLLLDGEAGPEGPRRLAEIEADAESKALYDFTRALDLSLRKSLPEEEPPPAIWDALQARLEVEPVPAVSLLDRAHYWLVSALRMPRRRLAFAGSSFLFLLTCGTLWWETGTGFAPPPRPLSGWSRPGVALDRGLSDQLEREAFEALDDMIFDYNTTQFLPAGAPAGDAPAGAEGGAP